MSKNRYIGMYFNETELVNRLDELKREGWPEDDIYVVVKNDDQLTMVRSRTDAEIKSADDSWWDRFMGFVSGEDHVRRMVENLDFGKEDTMEYYRDIEQGGMLLYVDSGEANRHYMDNTDFYGRDGKSTDVNLGANGLSVTDQELNGGDPAFRMSQTLPDQTINHQDNEVDRALHTEEHSLTDNDTDEERLRLHEERLQVDKHATQRGEIHVEKEVVEEPRSVDVSVSHDEVTIERRPVVDGEAVVNDRYGNDATAFREDDETIRIPITEEQVEVTKKPVVTEEVILKKREVVENETIHDTVKREEVHFDKEGDVDIKGDPLDKDRF
ncbi:YsnF/AvaK domain-containing protein [Sporosarcina ureae]|uniref:YsnF/AvaK domain-containing protein n=1 Tax=Sporosarcina ureae TaxID=1571 RepID=UPI0028A723EF|nr:YsnF/AvaK domain-containing protein [Sporosarcina ureae]